MLAERTGIAAHYITSAKNPLLREVRQAVVRGGLTRSGLCVAESFHLLEEAVRSNSSIEAVLAAESVWSTVERRFSGLHGLRLIRVPDDILSQLSATETTQGVIALVRPSAWQLDAVFRGRSLVVILDGVQDPGNAGAIVRAAEAFGASGAVFVKGSVNPFNPKAVRGSAGSIFRLPLVYGLETELALAALGQRGTDVYAAMPRASQMIDEVDLRRRCALVIGSEGRGVSEPFLRIAKEVRIPTCGVESLNASVAAGIVLYEAARQRREPR